MSTTPDIAQAVTTELDQLRYEVSELKLALLHKDQELEEVSKERSYWSNQHFEVHRRCDDAIRAIIASATFIVEKSSAIRELLRQVTYALEHATNIASVWDIEESTMRIKHLRELCSKAKSALKEADEKQG